MEFLSSSPITNFTSQNNSIFTAAQSVLNSLPRGRSRPTIVPYVPQDKGGRTKAGQYVQDLIPESDIILPQSTQGQSNGNDNNIFDTITDPIQSLTDGLNDVITNPVETITNTTSQLKDSIGLDTNFTTIAIIGGGILLIFFFMKK